MVNTDEWKGYNRLRGMGRGHATVDHADREWARDDDGDGVREVHCNTQEGLWTGLRNFLRPFRGVSKWYLAQYVAIFQWGYNIKAVTDEFLRTLLGCSSLTRMASCGLIVLRRFPPIAGRMACGGRSGSGEKGSVNDEPIPTQIFRKISIRQSRTHKCPSTFTEWIIGK